MKTKYSPIIGLFLLLAVFWACDKEEKPKVEESPFFVFFDEAAITIDTTPVAATTWEYGFVFNPLADGHITKLGLKLPITGSFTVKLWDLSGSTPIILSQQQISSASQHTPAFISISPIAVQKEARLGVTVLANSFYRLEKQNSTDFAFPRVVDHIRIVSFNEEMTNSGLAAFPEMTNTTRVAPCVNVVFVAD